MHYFAAQPIPVFGYAIRHAHFVSLTIYEVIRVKCSKLTSNVITDINS